MDQPTIKRVGLSPAGAALAGTALGIFGTFGTTAVAAHYTARDHAEDRAETREKERREALTKAYTAAIVSLHALEGEAVFYQNGHEEPPTKEVQYKTVPEDVSAALALIANPEAVKALNQASTDYVSLKITKAQSSDRYVAVAKFIESCGAFVQAARKDLEANAGLSRPAPPAPCR